MNKILPFEKRQKLEFLQKKLSEENVSIDKILNFLKGERGIAPTNLTMISVFNEPIYRARPLQITTVSPNHYLKKLVI